MPSFVLLNQNTTVKLKQIPEKLCHLLKASKEVKRLHNLYVSIKLVAYNLQRHTCLSFSLIRNFLEEKIAKSHQTLQLQV